MGEQEGKDGVSGRFQLSGSPSADHKSGLNLAPPGDRPSGKPGNQGSSGNGTTTSDE